MISLSKQYGEDAQEMKDVLTLFSSPGCRDAEIIKTGYRVTGSDLAIAGAAQAERHANETAPGWSDRAFEALCAFVQQHTGKFQAEDVRNWAQHVPPAPSNRAWGSVILKAAKAGIIKAVGYERVNNPQAHATPATVWAVV